MIVHVITGDDYRSGYYTRLISPGETNTSISIDIFEDNMFELNESFTLTFDPSITTCGVEVDPVDCMAVVTIVDNDGECIQNNYL